MSCPSDVRATKKDSRRRFHFSLWITSTYELLTGFFILTNHARAAPITDQEFFTNTPHTLISFDSDGAGQPVVLDECIFNDFSNGEYAPLGVEFSGIRFGWVHFCGVGWEDGHAIGGSLPNVMLTANNPNLQIEFVTPVRAFGFWLVVESPGPTFEALDQAGNVLESVTFSEPFIDGTIVFPPPIVHAPGLYGFMGIAREEGIATVLVSNADYTAFDNLRFIVVPEPTSLALLAVFSFGLVVNACRRRYGNGAPQQHAAAQL